MFFLNYFFNIYFMVIVYNDNRTWYENWQKYGTIKLSLQGKNDNEYRWHCYTCIYFIHYSAVILPCLLASCYCSCPCQHGDCMTSCTVSLSNDQCQNVSICHCVCLPTVIRFLFLIYIIKTLLLLLSEPLCLLHTRTPIVKASFLFYIPAPLSKLHCLLWSATSLFTFLLPLPPIYLLILS